MCTIVSQFMAKLKKFCVSLIKINLYKQINKQKKNKKNTVRTKMEKSTSY